ncbi:hypothetical protein B0H14DRAFT_3870500 [Mycena olivaceomarginata]|nr:hypothetical protein B0H14DRAFT_3870500 [Mycena olivaceomarginata]
MYSRLDLIRDFMLGLMVLATVDTLVKLGFHNIVAYVASLPPNFVLVIIAFNLLRGRAPGVSLDGFEPSTSLVVHAGLRQRSTDLALQLAARVQLFAVFLDAVYFLSLRRAFTIVKRPQAPGRGTISSPAPPSSSTKAFTNVQPTSPSHSHFSGLLESNSSRCPVP